MEKAPVKKWREGELIEVFQLKRIKDHQTPLLKEWLDVPNPIFDKVEQEIFDKNFIKVLNSIEGWSEEDLKMKFISHILELGYMVDDDKVLTYFDKMISATVQGTYLSVKTDFMMAKGILDVFRTPYFHFQEYKPNKNPTGDSMAQLLEAFLITQEMNKNNNPLYGIEIIGKQWTFVVMQAKEYCLSPTYICTDREDLLKIVSILRKFKEILYSKLLE